MCHVAAAAQLSGWRLACSAMDPRHSVTHAHPLDPPSQGSNATSHTPDDTRTHRIADKGLEGGTETTSKEREDICAGAVRAQLGATRERFARNTLPLTMLLSLSLPLFSPLLFSSPLGLWPSARGDGDSRCESPGRPKGRLPDSSLSSPYNIVHTAASLYG